MRIIHSQAGGITGIARRNCLLPEVFEARQLLKSAYLQGHISALTSAVVDG